MKKTAVCLISSEGANKSNEMVLKTVDALKKKDYFVSVGHRGNESSDFFIQLKSLVDKIGIDKPIVAKNNFSRSLMMSNGVGIQVKNSVRLALEEGFEDIIYMEGDKYSFVLEIEKLENTERDAIVAARSKEGFNSFPKIQRASESFFNSVAGAKLNMKTDFLYGPKKFSREVAQTIHDYKFNDWGTLIYPISRAFSEGKDISYVEVLGFPPKDYMQKYGKGFNPVKHLSWRIMQNFGNLRGLNEGLRK